MATVVRDAALAGDSKAAMDILKHRHDWVAKQQIQVDTTQQISISLALGLPRLTTTCCRPSARPQRRQAAQARASRCRESGEAGGRAIDAGPSRCDWLAVSCRLEPYAGNRCGRMVSSADAARPDAGHRRDDRRTHRHPLPVSSGPGAATLPHPGHRREGQGPQG